MATGLPTDEVGPVLFAIQSAIKLGTAFQKSYIDTTVATPITLPLLWQRWFPR